MWDQSEELKAKILEADRLDRPLVAIALLHRYVELRPDDSYFRFLLGEQLRVIGRYEEAETILLNLDRTSVPTEKHYLVELCLAQMYDHRHDPARAERHYRKALEAAPGSTIPVVYFGGFLAVSGRLVEARELLERGRTAEGDVDEVLYNLGNCKRALGDVHGALRCYREALALDPDYHLAEAAATDTAEAIDLLRHLHSDDDGSP